MSAVRQIDTDTGIDLDKIPQSQEAEQAVLGCLLYNNEVYHRISDVLQSKHFYNPIHVRIYDAIVSNIMAGKLADAIVLKNRFSQDETLVDIGGVEYLALLLEGAPPTSTARDYAKFVHDMAIRRQLYHFSQDVGVQSLDSETDKTPLEMVEDAEASLYLLAETGNHKRGFVTFSQSLVKTIENAAAAYARDGKLSGISTGLNDLDNQLGGLHKSDLIILAGRPSMGKTALATNIAFNVAKAFKEEKTESGEMKTVSGGRVGFFSLEMSSEQLSLRLLAQEARIPSTAIRRGDIHANQFETLRDVSSSIDAIPLHIDDTGGLSIGALAARARRLKRMHGLDLIVVDYLQLLNAGKKMSSGGNRTQEVTIITMELKALAKELDVPVLALAQLSRKVEEREDKRPQLADLRESGSIEQDADVVCFVYREEYYLGREEKDESHKDYHDWLDKFEKSKGKAEVIVGKQRHGPIGIIPLSFEDTFTHFRDLPREKFT